MSNGKPIRQGCRPASGFNLLIAFCLIRGLMAAGASPHPPSERAKLGPAANLQDLARRAARESVWPSLRRYAVSTKDSEERGLAYFALGYREYGAGETSRASADLARAAATGFSLADFALYYRAEAAQEPALVVEALQGFSTRYPESTLRYDALALLAQAFLQTSQPERAIEVLTAEPKVQQRPGLVLLLAKAYGQAQRLPEAAKAFGDVYHAFPAAPEAAVAGAALKRLKAQLGAGFPAVTEEVQVHRAARLLSASRYREALEEFNALIDSYPSSPSGSAWRLARARCLIRMKRVQDAVDALSGSFAGNPQADAERLATLVEAYSRLDNSASMLIVLDQLRNVYPQSESYRSALFWAGALFADKGDWATAVRYYQPLAEAAPTTDLGREASWRVAWAHYLQRDTDKAGPGFVEHLRHYPDSPHVPAALYWFGRLAEERGATSEARALYELLAKRFVDGYYPLQANRRLKSLNGDPAGRAGPAHAPTTPEAGGSPLAEALEKIRPREPPRAGLCAATPGEIPRPFLTLTALSLDDLAEQYLKTLLSNRPSGTEVLLALTNLQAEQGELSDALFNAKRLVPNYFEYQSSELPREMWQWLYPRAFWSVVQRQARLNRLDPYLVMALIRQESAFNPKATSVANARGLMQVLPKTAAKGLSRRRRRGVGQRLYDPAYNIRLACRYFREMLSAFNGNVEQALAAYNAGDFRVKDWLSQRSFRDPPEFVESIPFRETRLYVETVMRDEVVYRRLLSGSPRFMKCGQSAN
ncbi:MAG: hypothetical protein DMG26_01305 [Acidobacteria bacterium]|nr:MAG: hypothetical protein DMG26_01305 [Acidobacteriota bacterium]